MAISEEQVRTVLQTYTDPATGKDYVTGKEARNIRIEGNDVSLDIALGYPAKTVMETIRRELTERIGQIARKWPSEFSGLLERYWLICCGVLC